MSSDKKSDDPGQPGYWLAGMDEAHVPFVHASVPLPALTQLYGAVLQAYGHRCAMTGVSGTPGLGVMVDGLAATAIQPLAAGGAQHVNNFICLADAAKAAFECGHIAIGPGLELLVDLSRIDPELLERLNPLGRLRAPDDRHAQPDQAALAVHRREIFLGQPGVPG